jgi:hypothetical protein
MKHHMIAICGAFLAQVIHSNTASANELIFHPETAIYAGNGCPQGSTAISVDELGDLYIDHSALAILLPAGGSNQALAARSTCIVRVPVTVPKGLYVKSIQQSLSYAVAKSANADLQLASRAAFSSDSVHPFIISLPAGDEVYSDHSIDTRLDHLDSAKQRAKYCRDERPSEMIFQVQIAISGQRDSVMDDLLAAANGSHIGEGIEVELGSCQ